MSMTDTTADFLTRIRNAITASHETVETPASGMAREIARILQEQGYIEGYEVEPPVPAPRGTGGRNFEQLNVRLRYTDERQSVISGLRRVSRPGRRTYVDARSIPKVQGGMGTVIISTSRGLMTGHDARRAGIGGEVVAEVW